MKKKNKKKQERPDLSVAIMFKNEIRCLERCLLSLQPLRERLSMQIVMADTGSDDGSRAVAERYADKLFDFPWSNDFAAARNAVLRRCRGVWALVIDSDEWLDADPAALADLTALVRGRMLPRCDGATVTVRNYTLPDFSAWSDVVLTRLLRMDSMPRYAGAIHEAPAFPGRHIIRADSVLLLHHDGYVMLNDGSEAGRAKNQRNLALLQEELVRQPESAEHWMHYLSAAAEEPDFADSVRHAAALVLEQKARQWKEYGSAILRSAVKAAYNNQLPERDFWATEAVRLFPDSYLTRIDIPFIMLHAARDGKAYEDAVRWGEIYLRGSEAFAADPDAEAELRVRTLLFNGPVFVRDAKLILARAHCELSQPEQAADVLYGMDWTTFEGEHTLYVIRLFERLHAECGFDISRLLSACWEGIQEPKPTPACAAERTAAFRRLVSVEEPAPEQDGPSGAGKTDELVRLAAKVKDILAKLPPDDPIIVELKGSKAYQKVAHLIEQ